MDWKSKVAELRTQVSTYYANLTPPQRKKLGIATGIVVFLALVVIFPRGERSMALSIPFPEVREAMRERIHDMDGYRKGADDFDRYLDEVHARATYEVFDRFGKTPADPMSVQQYFEEMYSQMMSRAFAEDRGDLGTILREAYLEFEKERKGTTRR